MSIKTRLQLLVAISLIGLSILVGISLHALARLANLQDEGYELAQTQASAGEASLIGAQLYQVVADAIINRDLDKAKSDFAKQRSEAESDLEKLAKAADTEAEKQAVADARKAVETLAGLFEKQLLPILTEQNQFNPEIRKIDGSIDTQVQIIRDKLHVVAHSMADEAKKGDVLFDETRRFTSWEMVLVAMAAAGIVALVAWRIIASIMAPLQAVQTVAARIANGDLSGAIRVEGPVEVAAVLTSCDAMQTALRTTAGDLQRSAADIQSMSEQMASATGQLAQASDVQSQAAAAMAASVEEMSVSIAQVSDNAREVSSAAEQSSAISAEGRQIIQSLVSADTGTSRSVETTAAQIGQLSELSGQISSIVAVIRGIADQTNLLALNAAIEAARAGEQGRGFAVVADEVRKLAERTTQSTQEIGGMISQVQAVTNEAVSSMETVVSDMAGLIRLSEEADGMIGRIADQSATVLGVVGSITGALHEQSGASTDIARRVESIAQMSEENSAAVQETAGTARRLSTLAADLTASARRFCLN